jgi:hypothetical protein
MSQDSTCRYGGFGFDHQRFCNRGERVRRSLQRVRQPSRSLYLLCSPLTAGIEPRSSLTSLTGRCAVHLLSDSNLTSSVDGCLMSLCLFMIGAPYHAYVDLYTRLKDSCSLAVIAPSSCPPLASQHLRCLFISTMRILSLQAFLDLVSHLDLMTMRSIHMPPFFTYASA